MNNDNGMNMLDNFFKDKFPEEEDIPHCVGPVVCTIPLKGWYCTRVAGHDGPCAAWPVDHKEKP